MWCGSLLSLQLYGCGWCYAVSVVMGNLVIFHTDTGFSESLWDSTVLFKRQTEKEIFSTNKVNRLSVFRNFRFLLNCRTIDVSHFLFIFAVCLIIKSFSFISFVYFLFDTVTRCIVLWHIFSHIFSFHVCFCTLCFMRISCAGGLAVVYAVLSLEFALIFRLLASLVNNP